MQWVIKGAIDGSLTRSNAAVLFFLGGLSACWLRRMVIEVDRKQVGNSRRGEGAEPETKCTMLKIGL